MESNITADVNRLVSRTWTNAEEISGQQFLPFWILIFIAVLHGVLSNSNENSKQIRKHKSPMSTFLSRSPNEYNTGPKQRLINGTTETLISQSPSSHRPRNQVLVSTVFLSCICFTSVQRLLIFAYLSYRERCQSEAGRTGKWVTLTSGSRVSPIWIHSFAF